MYIILSSCRYIIIIDTPIHCGGVPIIGVRLALLGKCSVAASYSMIYLYSALLKTGKLFVSVVSIMMMVLQNYKSSFGGSQCLI